MCIEIINRRTKAVRHVPLDEARKTVQAITHQRVTRTEPITARYAAIMCGATRVDQDHAAYVGPTHTVRPVAE